MNIEFDEYRLELDALTEKIDNLAKAIGFSELRSTVEKLEKQAEDESFWSDLENSQKVLKETKQKKDKIEAHEILVSRWEDAKTLVALAISESEGELLDEIRQEYNEIVKTIEARTLGTLLTGEHDNSNAILSFHPGAGGTEAQDWAEMLYRMYTRYSERSGFHYKLLDYLEGDGAGIKSATILIEGENAYGYLKGEMGVHRLVRISPFDSSGRRHTSFASLEVMPEFNDSVKIDIRDEDLKVDTYRSGGAGGQHVNKTESAIRITHIPSGVIVACQNERSQHQNREMAMKMLKSKLLEIKERERLERVEDIKGDQREIAWGSQIRSYTFMPYTLVKDHRTGYENGNVGAVMDGDVDGFINAYLISLQNEKLS